MTLKNTSSTSLSLGKDTKFWLLVITIGLMAVHLNTIYRHGDASLQSISIVFFAAVLFLLEKKDKTFSLDSDVLSKFVGLGIIVLVLVRSVSISSFDYFIQIHPFLSAIGLSLIASGVKGLKQYSQELILLFALAIPFEAVIPQLVDLATLTAKGAATMLWCLGFQAQSQGIDVILPTAAVKVVEECSGFKVVTRLLRLAILFLVIFPTDWLKGILISALAVLIGFLGNVARVAVLAVMLASSNNNLFEFFHGIGGHLFTITSVIIFALICYLMVRQDISEV